jgi:hypothetical protein
VYPFPRRGTTILRKALGPKFQRALYKVNLRDPRLYARWSPREGRHNSPYSPLISLA